MSGKRVAIVLALIVGAVVSGLPGPRPAPLRPAADRKALTAKLQSRATEWLNARKKSSIVIDCYVCGADGNNNGQPCGTCKGKASIFSPDKVKKVLLEFQTPAFRNRPHAKEELQKQYDALMAGNGPDIVLTSFRSVRPFMVDDTHGTVDVIENSSTGEAQKTYEWILISTGGNSTEWDRWTEGFDGPWPDHPVPEAEPAPVEKPVAKATPVEPPKKAAPVAEPKPAPPAAAAPAARGSLLKSLPLARPTLPFDPAHSAGLFVGVRTFVDSGTGAPSDTWPEVEFAVDDAIDLAYAFSIELKLIMPDRVHLCLSGTALKSESLARFEELRALGATIESAPRNRLRDKVRIVCKQAELGGLLVMAFASHGAHMEDGDDCIYTQDSLFGDHGSGLSARFVRQLTQESLAPRKILLFDCCREIMAKSRGGTAAEPLSPTLAKTLGEVQGTIVLCASSVGGFSYDDRKYKNGVFTRAFLDGLRGEAQADANGLITLGAVVNYVNSRVKEWIILNRPGASVPGNVDQSGDKDLEKLPLAQRKDAPKAVAPKTPVPKSGTDSH